MAFIATGVGSSIAFVTCGAVSDGIPLGAAAGVKELTSRASRSEIAAFSAAAAAAAASACLWVSAALAASALEALSFTDEEEDDEELLLELEPPTESTPMEVSTACECVI
ncbi:hypothetical protein [Pyxidicoccus sp. MSG2]|uniref:hypothetical protein n=1 Tax=Pyxidicoccus sp. MSG2 TaxID=2996790 RepID=UPI0022707B83|nr:hypothetical protein [Pyxidicoccus sp. MSG2]MCY1021235.1 hypothetical protein [Pyxidicoccus sp. MSG2]